MLNAHTIHTDTVNKPAIPRFAELTSFGTVQNGFYIWKGVVYSIYIHMYNIYTFYPIGMYIQLNNIGKFQHPNYA